MPAVTGMAKNTLFWASRRDLQEMYLWTLFCWQQKPAILAPIQLPISTVQNVCRYLGSNSYCWGSCPSSTAMSKTVPNPSKSIVAATMIARKPLFCYYQTVRIYSWSFTLASKSSGKRRSRQRLSFLLVLFDGWTTAGQPLSFWAENSRIQPTLCKIYKRSQQAKLPYPDSNQPPDS